MRINKIEISKDKTEALGLSEIRLEGLKSVVALIGKNGAGKTRILNLIEDEFSKNFNINYLFNGIVTEFPDSIHNLKKYLDFLDAQETYIHADAKRKSSPQNMQLRADVVKAKNDYVKRRGEFTKEEHNTLEYIVKNISSYGKNYIKKIDYNQIRQLQDAISESEDDSDSFEKIIESVTELLEYNELGIIYKSSLKFLKRLPQKLVADWNECLGNTQKLELKASYRRYKSLKEIFDKMFGKSLEWDKKIINTNITDEGVNSLQSGYWKINDREFKYSEFSEGEKTLFAFVLLFFLMSQNPGIRLKDSIIIIDTPELHLHADAEIELINGLRNIIHEKGQLLIATHSINILSQLNVDEIFAVKEGTISHPSRSIQFQALKELLKIEDRLLKLSEFLTSLEEWAYVNFMTECFNEPEVIEVSRSNDPQVKTLLDLISLNNDIEKTILLDFGAGKGRLFEQASENKKFNKSVEYHALEPNSEFHSLLKSKGIKDIYTQHDQLPKTKYDIVVICNVLHEIDILRWTTVINDLIDSLKQNGNLIIMEAKVLSKGEQIGTHGYLILDESELKVLFNLEDHPYELKSKNENINLTSFLINKSSIKNQISDDDLMRALKAVEKNSLEKLESLRQESDSSSNSTKNKRGRTAAFLSQLHINSKLAQKTLTTTITV